MAAQNLAALKEGSNASSCSATACNEYNEPITTFGFADEHEARIARPLMIRAMANAVLIISHASIARQKSSARSSRSSTSSFDGRNLAA
jgi:hypothetical protein